MTNYQDFIQSKRHSEKPQIKSAEFMPGCIFDFQRYLVELSLSNSRYAIFADTGMGKTIMQLTWAENVYRITGKPVMILAPLVVTFQTEAESKKFGINNASVSRNGKIESPIVITNYEQLTKFDSSKFGGVCCDESGILKSLDGSIRNQIVSFMRKVDYRLLCSATPAPNDFIELGSSSEALGVMGQIDMMQKFFRNNRDTCSSRRHFGEAPKWQFRGHSEVPFWRWVSSWARAVKRPSDIGFSDDGYKMPNLITNNNIVETPPPEGMLFSLPAVSLADQRVEIKRTLKERCELAAGLNDHSDSFIAWCNLNPEAKLLKELMPDAVEISGTDSDDAKIEKFKAFTSGQARGLITKPKIGAWGLNFQHCHNMTYFPNHSYEQWYQSVRRCWRYGQKHDVNVDVVYTPGEQRILDNMAQKGKKAESMYAQLIEQMNNPETAVKKTYTERKELPTWLAK